MLQCGIVATSKAELDVKSSTLRHRKLGRKSRAEADQLRQKLTPQEEEYLVDRCEHLNTSKCGDHSLDGDVSEVGVSSESEVEGATLRACSVVHSQRVRGFESKVVTELNREL
jgi:cobalamin biosynthesis Mg chelatase CobN